MTILREIVQLFQKEKIYLFLLLGVIFFYALVFITLQPKANHDAPVDPAKARVEAILREAPQSAQEVEKKLAARPNLKWVVQLFSILLISSFLYGIWLGTVDLRKFFNRQELIPRTEQLTQVSWGIQEIVKVLILFFASVVPLNLGLATAKFIFSLSLEHSTFILVHTLILDVTAVGFIIYSVKKKGSSVYDLTGMYPGRNWGDELWWGIRSYFLIIPIFISLLVILVIISALLSYEPPPHPLVEVLLEEEQLSGWTIFFSLFLACGVGPIVEEVFFRGFFYPALRKYLGVGRTMIVTAALFAIVHENFFAFIPIFFLGLVLCYLYEKRANLVSCVTLHMLHNGIFIVYFFLMKTVLLDH